MSVHLTLVHCTMENGEDGVLYLTTTENVKNSETKIFQKQQQDQRDGSVDWNACSACGSPVFSSQHFCSAMSTAKMTPLAPSLSSPLTLQCAPKISDKNKRKNYVQCAAYLRENSCVCWLYTQRISVKDT